jgi:hypothetical protein
MWIFQKSNWILALETKSHNFYWGCRPSTKTWRLARAYLRFWNRSYLMISIPQTAGPVELWSVLVLCTLRLNCNWDYEELLKTDNNHKAVRDFLGYTLYEFGEQYALETLKDNVSLFTPEHIDQINQVAKVGYKMLGYDKKSINCV